MNVRHFFVEAIRSIRSNASISFAATVASLLAFFLLGSFIQTYKVVNKEVSDQKALLFVSAYIRDDATVAQLSALEAKIKATEHVKSVELVEKAEALARYKERFGSDPSQDLGVNPLPRSFEITPDDGDNAQSIATALGGTPNSLTNEPALLRDPIAPTGVEYGGADAEVFLKVANFIKLGGLGLVIVLVIASILLIANTIRLSIFARRREVEVMKLVGATNWFIRWPFMIEGVICGVGGAILAVVLMIGMKLAVVDRLVDLTTTSTGPLGAASSNDTLREAFSTGGLAKIALYLLISGAVVGAAGSGFTLRRFLRV